MVDPEGWPSEQPPRDAAARQQAGPMAERSGSVPFVIAQPCVGVKDTACVTVCPVDCIHPTKEEAAFAAAAMLHVDRTVCVDGGLCVDECPVKAVFAEDDLPAECAGRRSNLRGVLATLKDFFTDNPDWA